MKPINLKRASLAEYFLFINGFIVEQLTFFY